VDTRRHCAYCDEVVFSPCQTKTHSLGCIHPKIRPTVESKIASDGGSTDYYKLPDGAKELLDLIEHKQMNFNVGNIFKAAYRLGEKAGNDLSYDLKKIIFFAERELARTKAPERSYAPRSPAQQEDRS
jgi:hypothetical protein